MQSIPLRTVDPEFLDRFEHGAVGDELGDRVQIPRLRQADDGLDHHAVFIVLIRIADEDGRGRARRMRVCRARPSVRAGSVTLNGVDLEVVVFRRRAVLAAEGYLEVPRSAGHDGSR
jgi:hypothetical protein